MVDDDTNGQFDILVRDVKTGVTERVSVDSNGAQTDIDCFNPSISDDGRYVVFQSAADDLVANDTNSHEDIFIHDRKTGTTKLVSLDSNGNQLGGAIPFISANGHFVVFQADAQGFVSQIFVRDLKKGKTTRVSVDSAGTSGDANSNNGSISNNGRYISFTSGANNLVPNDMGFADVFRHDRKTGVTTRISVDSSEVAGNNVSYQNKISGNGKAVVFSSVATNFGGGPGTKYEVFIRDVKKGTTIAASVDGLGAFAAFDCLNLSISENGKLVTFESFDPNLVLGDSNAEYDVFLRNVK